MKTYVFTIETPVGRRVDGTTSWERHTFAVRVSDKADVDMTEDQAWNFCRRGMSPEVKRIRCETETE